MKFYCDSCNAKYQISDERVRGKVLKIRCKKCNHLMVVREPKQPVQAESAPGPDVTQWHYSVAGQTFGPMPLTELQTKFQSGELGDEAYVWHPDMAGWEQASGHELFKGYFARGEARQPHKPTMALEAVQVQQSRPATQAALPAQNRESRSILARASAARGSATGAAPLSRSGGGGSSTRLRARGHDVDPKARLQKLRNKIGKEKSGLNERPLEGADLKVSDAFAQIQAKPAAAGELRPMQAAFKEDDAGDSTVVMSSGDALQAAFAADQNATAVVADSQKLADVMNEAVDSDGLPPSIFDTPTREAGTPAELTPQLQVAPAAAAEPQPAPVAFEPTRPEPVVEPPAEEPPAQVEPAGEAPGPEDEAPTEVVAPVSLEVSEPAEPDFEALARASIPPGSGLGKSPEPIAPAPAPSSNSKSPVLIGILALVLLLAVGGGVAAMLLGSNGEEVEAKEPANGGLAEVAPDNSEAPKEAAEPKPEEKVEEDVKEVELPPEEMTFTEPDVVGKPNTPGAGAKPKVKGLDLGRFKMGKGSGGDALSKALSNSNETKTEKGKSLHDKVDSESGKTASADVGSGLSKKGTPDLYGSLGKGRKTSVEGREKKEVESGQAPSLPSTLNKSDLVRGFKNVRRSADQCLERHIKRAGSLPKSKVKVVVTIDGSGRVKAVSMDAAVRNTVFESCMRSHRGRWRFPQFSGKPLQVSRVFLMQ